MTRLIPILTLLLAPALAAADDAERLYRSDHVVVTYAGVSEAYAEAIAATVETARAVCAEHYGFDMPETIHVSVRANPRGRIRLFNDGQDRLVLTVRRERDLQKPATTGIFHIYGLCHEVGHLAMYRAIRDHSWITPAASEGWAHYIGSHVVDKVHAKRGASLWPDAYDYLADGTQRLNRQLAAAKGHPGAKLWGDLAAIVGDRGVAPIFAAWGAAQFEPTDPGAAMRKSLLATGADPKLAAWWNGAEPVMVSKQPRSGFVARTPKPGEMARKPTELAHDDGVHAGSKSTAGGGHAVRFATVGDTWYLTGVRVHGSRYGYPRAPNENFHLWLCDKDLNVIADFQFPYARFTKGQAKWVMLPIRPTQVPTDFIVCVGFNPTGTKGVYVSRDAESSGNSLTALPGKSSRDFTAGDWLIRASVDQLKIANPLRKDKSAIRAK